jgi:transcriptional regulator with XRE-family HTH domain
MNLNRHEGEMLRLYLKNKGMTSKYLVDKLGVSTAAVSKYLKSQQFRPDTLESILKGLGITKEELFGEEKTEDYVPLKEYEKVVHEKNKLLEEVAEYRKKEIERLQAERITGVSPIY